MSKRNNSDVICEKIVNKFLKKYLIDTNDSVKKIKKLVRLDEDLIIMNFQEVIDLINFNIFMERERVYNESIDNSELNIPKLTDYIENSESDEHFFNNENQYTEEEFKNYISELSKSLSFNFFEKNENIIITFI